MDRDEIKAKLGELAKIDDESAIFPQTLLEIMEADEESAVRVASMRKEILKHIADNATQINEKTEALNLQADEKSNSHIANINEKIEALKNETARRNSYNMYISIAILVVMLVAIIGFAW